MDSILTTHSPQLKSNILASVLCIAVATGMRALLDNVCADQSHAALRAASLFVFAMSAGFIWFKNMLVITDSVRFPQSEQALHRVLPLVYASAVSVFIVDYESIKFFDEGTFAFLNSGAWRRYIYTVLSVGSVFVAQQVFDKEPKPAASGAVASGASGAERHHRSGKGWAIGSTILLCLTILLLSTEHFVLPAGMAPNPMAAVNVIVTGFLSSIAMIYMIGIRTKTLSSTDEIRLVGRLVFGFSIFWAYINFSELLITTYSLSSEVASGAIAGYANFGRVYVSYLLCFAIPFIFLLTKNAKSNSLLLRLASVAIIHGSYIVVLRYFDLSLNIASAIAIIAMTGWWALFWVTARMRTEK